MPIKVNCKNIERIIKTGASGQLTEIEKVYSDNTVVWSKKSDTDTSELFAKMADQLAYLINQERTANGLNQLYAVPYLNECCMIRAEEQASLAGHVRPNGQWFSDIIDWDIFSWGLISENIASGSKLAEEVVQYWKNSAGKVWSAAMNENYTHTGIGVYYDGNNKKWHWVQFYTNDAESDIVHEGQYLPTKQEGL